MKRFLAFVFFLVFSIFATAQSLSPAALPVFNSLALYLDLTPLTCPKEITKPNYRCYSTIKMKSENIKEAMRNLNGATQIVAWQRPSSKHLLGAFYWKGIGFSMSILDTNAGLIPYRLITLLPLK
jgi:hypothetical protein